MNKSLRLRELIWPGAAFVMPDAYDALSARLIERLGFQAVQCSGFSMALAACSQQEAALGLEENLHITKRIVEAVSVPVMADGEDGFGDAPQVDQTVRQYIEVGAAGVNIEDQVLGLPGGAKAVIDRKAMVDKIAAARSAAASTGNPEFFVNSRTDALAVAQDRGAGLTEAIERANRYLQAGGDLAFVTGVATAEEASTLVREIAGPVSVAAGMPYNMGLSLVQLKACGVARVSLPTVAISASLEAMTQVLAAIQAGEGFAAMAGRGLLASMKTITDLLSTTARPERNSK